MDKYQKIVVSGFLLYLGKLLILKRSSSEPLYPNLFELPSGKVEFGEDTDTALKREFSEETGLSISVEQPILTFTYVTDGGKRHTVEIWFLVKINDGNDNVRLNEEHTDFKWITKDEIANYPMSKGMREMITLAFKKIS